MLGALPKTPETQELSTWNAKQEPLHVFVGYADIDSKYLQELEEHLHGNQGLITVWHNALTGPGEITEEHIRINLEKADILIVFISANYLSHHSNELEMILKRHAQGKTRLFPILARPTFLKNSILKKFKFVNREPLSRQRPSGRDFLFVQINCQIRNHCFEIINRTISALDENNRAQFIISIEMPSDKISWEAVSDYMNQMSVHLPTGARLRLCHISEYVKISNRTGFDEVLALLFALYGTYQFGIAYHDAPHGLFYLWVDCDKTHSNALKITDLDNRQIVGIERSPTKREKAKLVMLVFLAPLIYVILSIVYSVFIEILR